MLAAAEGSEVDSAQWSDPIWQFLRSFLELSACVMHGGTSLQPCIYLAGCNSNPTAAVQKKKQNQGLSSHWLDFHDRRRAALKAFVPLERGWKEKWDKGN